jgi:hypothetical protein
MRRLLLTLTALVLMTGGGNAQSTRAQLNAYNNQYIVPNGVGAITGQILNHALGIVISGAGILGDYNSWTGTNSFTVNPTFLNCSGYLFGNASLASTCATMISVSGGGTGAASFSANLPIIGNGSSALAQGTVTGNTTEFATSTGAQTSGDCVKIDASGNHVDAGFACGYLAQGVAAVNLGIVDSTAYASISAAITAIGSSQATLWIGANSTLVANTTVPSNITLWIPQGNQISSGGHTLTINGPFNAGTYQVFSGFGSGSITFGVGFVQALYAEWWGAISYGVSPSTDSTVAINALLTSMTANSNQYWSMLDGGYLSATCGFQMTIGGVGIVGNGSGWTGILCTNTTADILDVQGSSIGAQINSNFLRGFYLIRFNVTATAGIGLYQRFSINMKLNDVLSSNNLIGAQVAGSGDSYWKNYVSNYTLSGSVTYKGLFIDGSQGNNASIYFEDSNMAIIGGTSATSYGVYATGSQMQDVRLIHVETASMTYGKFFNSGASSCPNTPATNCDTDIHIDDSIDDGCTADCIVLDNFSSNGNVSIKGGWSYLGTGGLNDILVENSTAAIAITAGYQFWGSTAINTGQCLEILSSSNVTVNGNVFTNCIVGVNLLTATYNTLGLNTFENVSTATATEDIALGSSPNNTFTANTFNGYSAYAFNSDAASAGSVLQGNLINSSNITTPYSGITPIGGRIVSNVAVGSAVNLSTGSPANVTSIALSIGTWQVAGSVAFNGGSATTRTYELAWSNTTSATYPGSPQAISNNNPLTPVGSVTDDAYAIPTSFYTLGAAATAYLGAQAGFGTSTLKAYGAITATRIQ